MARDLCLLDGGMGHLLKQWGLNHTDLPYEQQFVASCLALDTWPTFVSQAHTAYISAGCSIITTNNFVATPHSLGKVGKAADSLHFCQQAGRLARQAAATREHSILVAGSLPPLQESYQTTGLPDTASLTQQYTDIARELAPYADVFLAETLSTLREAQAALAAAAHVAPDKPVWVSFTLEDSTAVRLRDKQPLASALQQLLQHPAANHLAALLVNCCAPAAATAAVPVLKQHARAGVRVGCYANGFQTPTTQWLTGSDEGVVQPAAGDYGPDGIITPEAYLRHAQAWVAAGADIIGGCCGIGPEHMTLLTHSL